MLLLKKLSIIFFVVFLVGELLIVIIDKHKLDMYYISMHRTN